MDDSVLAGGRLDRARGLAQPLVPRRMRPAVTRIVLGLAALALRGVGVSCPCCGRSFRAFLAYPSAVCPGCGSYERHRLLCLYLRSRPDLFRGHLRVLHVGPERCLQRRLQRTPAVAYVSIDLDYPLADLQMDVTRMSFSDAAFDLVLCAHVLDAVVDERRAARELARVLRAGGLALVQTPVHLAADLPRVRSVLEEAGFAVEEHRYAEALGEDLRRGQGLLADEALLLCTKR